MGPPRPIVPHQFETKAQHNEVNVLGMWLFLAQEIMFFGGLFTAYSVYRFRYPDAWAEGAHHLNRWMGGGNTVVLLVSSLTMALAVYCTQKGNFRGLITNLILTLSLGTVFLVVKYFEYKEKYLHGLIPGIAWDPHDIDLTIANPEKVKLYFILYFTMTGMHALHMIIGVAVGLVILALAWMRKFGPNKYMPVEIFGFYWHFVDIVWVFLFPLIYLIPKHHLGM